MIESRRLYAKEKRYRQFLVCFINLSFRPLAWLLFNGSHRIFFFRNSPNSFNLDAPLKGGQERKLRVFNCKDKALGWCILWFVNIHGRPCYNPLKLAFILPLRKRHEVFYYIESLFRLKRNSMARNLYSQKDKMIICWHTKFQSGKCVALWRTKLPKLHDFSLFH